MWVENPWLSFLWQQPEWLQVAASPGMGWFVTDYCVWGTPWRKRTAFLTNTSLQQQKVCCRCAKPHVQLKGYCKERRTMWTKLAEPYPARLCKVLAAAVTEQMKPIERRRSLDVAACARCFRRCGEASNPGPRPRAREAERPEDLEAMQRVENTMQRCCRLGSTADISAGFNANWETKLWTRFESNRIFR